MTNPGSNRYELYVGQPPFYTNSVYALIRHIVKVHQSCLLLKKFSNSHNSIVKDKLIQGNLGFQDPVKYPDEMSPSFKSFLRGLLNKVFYCYDFIRTTEFSFYFINKIIIWLKLMANRIPQIDWHGLHLLNIHLWRKPQMNWRPR